MRPPLLFRETDDSKTPRTSLSSGPNSSSTYRHFLSRSATAPQQTCPQLRIHALTFKQQNAVSQSQRGAPNPPVFLLTGFIFSCHRGDQTVRDYGMLGDIEIDDVARSPLM
uniref:Uncharacterized protein n=1 Tax=Knipowitschia caucasica TaxID=637954 RepID=A0AAV2KX82_KNICA